MRAILPLLLAALLLGCSARPPQVAGHWSGRVGDEQGETDILVDLTSGPGGGAGTMSLPGRRLLGKALGDVRIDGERIAFTLPARDRLLRFEGRIDGDELRGNVAGIGRGYPLWLRRAAAPSLPYREQEIAFASAGATLHGALLLPPGPGPFPAVILIHGSSTPDRNDYRYFADLYARHGIAAFIYDKRPTGAETNGGTVSLERLAGDVIAAAAMLEARADIDRRRIGLWSFSQGGWVAPIAASRHRFAFLVACSAPAVSFAEVTLYADAARLRAHHLSETEIGEAMRAERRLDDYVRRGDAAAMQAMLDAARRSRWAGLTTLPGAIPTAAERRLYLRWVDLDLDPLAFWRRLNLPVLIAYGTADENVPAEESARRIAAALAGRDVSLRRYPGANHNLVPAPGLEADLIGWTRAALRRPPA
jgi:uncharacterized protein